MVLLCKSDGGFNMSDLEWLIDYLEDVNNNKKIVKIYDFNITQIFLGANMSEKNLCLFTSKP